MAWCRVDFHYLGGSSWRLSDGQSRVYEVLPTGGLSSVKTDRLAMFRYTHLFLRAGRLGILSIAGFVNGFQDALRDGWNEPRDMEIPCSS